MTKHHTPSRRMNPHAVLKQAAGLIGDRGQDYGGIEDNFKNIANIANAMLGTSLDAFQVSMILAAVKIARMRQSPYKDDNYLDGINYIAFAHELRPTPKSNTPDPLHEISDVELRQIMREAHAILYNFEEEFTNPS